MLERHDNVTPSHIRSICCVLQGSAGHSSLNAGTVSGYPQLHTAHRLSFSVDPADPDFLCRHNFERTLIPIVARRDADSACAYDLLIGEPEPEKAVGNNVGCRNTELGITVLVGHDNLVDWRLISLLPWMEILDLDSRLHLALWRYPMCHERERLYEISYRLWLALQICPQKRYQSGSYRRAGRLLLPAHRTPQSQKDRSTVVRRKIPVTRHLRAL